MSISYTRFIEKYSLFSTLQEFRFNVFLPDVLAEIERYNWGSLKDKATELLLAHNLAIASGQKSPSDLQSLEVNDEGYKIAYPSPKQGEYVTTVWGKEYQRLLQQVQPVASSEQVAARSVFHAVRSDPNPLRW